MSEAVLIYFKIRGKGEPIRLVLAASGVKWSQIYITEHEQFLKLKADKRLLFEQAPLVEFEGKDLVQTPVIVKLFAKRGNLLGSSEDEQLKIEILYEGTRDFVQPFFPYLFAGKETILEELKTKTCPKFLPIFENSLVENGSNGFLVGSKLTLADLGLVEVLIYVEDYFGSDALNAYPNCQKFLHNITNIPAIKDYLNGPDMPPRVTEESAKEIMKALFG